MFKHAINHGIRSKGNDYNYLLNLIVDESQKNADMFIFPSKITQY